VTSSVPEPPLRAGLALPVADGLELAALQASTCASCGRTEFPALSDCPSCGGEASPRTLGPQATLAGFTSVLHPPPGARIPVPYTLAVAAFEGNISVLGVLAPYRPVEDLRIGQPLETILYAPYEGASTYAFRVVDEPSNAS
jgi:uncharacterized OB-fold protein